MTSPILRDCCQQVLLDHYSECSGRRQPDDSTPVPEMRVTRYEVSCLPEDDINAYSFTIAIEYRGRGLWAVLDGPFAYDAEGRKSYEPRPSSREDEWLARHRFDLATAERIAVKVAKTMTVNGHTVADALATAASESADPADGAPFDITPERKEGGPIL